MEIGIPAEQTPSEHRVGLTPQGVRLLAGAGHRVYVEQGAGQGAGFRDERYEQAGGHIVYSAREVYERSDLVLKVGCPSQAELDLLREEQTIVALWHLAAQPRQVAETLSTRRITAIAYEMIQQEDGTLPVLAPLSEIAGRMAPQVAARWLQNDGGGSGVLLSGVSGVPPVEVCIIGAGVVGLNAAWGFLGAGARVTMLDKDLKRLQHVDERFEGRVTTMVSYDFNIANALRRASVAVGCVLVPGERAPVLVTREMVHDMHPRSVILDISIDQGGCVETSRLMSHDNPVFIEEDVIHYCVPNMPGVVARTATHAYLNAAWPYIKKLVFQGIDATIESDPALMRGTLVRKGEVVNPRLAELLKGVQG
jgi:alanine dehydrogenase